MSVSLKCRGSIVANRNMKLANGMLPTLRLVPMVIGLLACAAQIPSLPPTVASDEAAIIGRGRYLVYGPAGCARCHTDRAQLKRLQAGEALPLTGGRHWANSLGDIYGTNLTSDTVTGLGDWSDGEIARAIRHGVHKNGEVLAPMMEYADIKDEDLQAIVSFLRSLDPIEAQVPTKRWSVVGRIAKAVALQPQMPSGRSYGERAATAEYGAYLANVLSACVACHTEQDQTTGKFVGAPLAGGTRFPHEEDPAKVVVPPNITPDKRTGRIAWMSEDQFIMRMRAGPIVQMTDMPWGGFKRTEDLDLRAIYRYLMSLEPVEKETGPELQAIEVDAHATPVASAEGDAAAGQVLFGVCSTCHGPAGGGNQAIGAPRIAGQNPWYIKRQIANLKAGIRGAKPEDVFGSLMRSMAPTLTDDQAVEDVIAYLETLTPEILPKTIEGDVAKGKELYQVCGACHGDDGKGIEERSTQRIAGEPDWYLERQIGNFSKGIRGDHVDDIFGRQMAVITDLMLKDEQAVKDMIAYINTMPAD